MHVVATAGHVDHGKSTLVRALTGTDPDRLAEERRRGLSIELGYAWTVLPGLPGAGEVAFVDVPGHQRFVTTMLAGVGPVPVALLVVAADDPWMPQAAEHLAALDALGVRHGLLVVSRSDLADPAPALARLRAETAPTSLAGAPALAVSARTGEGLDLLREALVDVLAAVPRPDPGADVRLWVDRSFTVRGAGRVVTGTLPAGTVAVGDVLLAGDGPVRVRGVESLGVARERVSGPARVALRLSGRAADDLPRGTPLVGPDAFRATSVVDVAVADAPSLPRQPVLHVGAAHLGVHVRPLGGSAARLRLETPLPLRVGDRLLLRDPGSREVVGVDVLDPDPPGLRRRGAGAARGRDLAGLDGSAEADLRLRGLARAATLRRIGVLTADQVPAGAVGAGGWLLSAERAVEHRSSLARLVADAHDAGQRGPSAAEAAHRLGLPDPALVEALASGSGLGVERGRLVDPSRGRSGVPPEVESLRELLAAAPFAAPDAGALRDLGLDDGALGRLHRDGHVLRIGPGLALLPGADDEAVTRLARLEQPFTTSQARQVLATSRRVALPLLAHLDRTGRTVRLADDRRRLRATP